MKTHLLLSHLENEMHCPLCSLSGISYDEMSFHISTAHAEMHDVSTVDQRSGSRRHPAGCGKVTTHQPVPPNEGLPTLGLPSGTRSAQPPVTGVETDSGTTSGDVHVTDASIQRPNSCTVLKKVRQDNSDTHLTVKQKRLYSPVKEKLFPCPMCTLVCQDCRILEEHVELHLQQQTTSDVTNTAGEGSATSSNTTGSSYECPLCNLSFWDELSLQEHVDLHLENGAATDTPSSSSSSSDLELAMRLQEEEEQRRRDEEAKQEAEEFKKLQRQFGVDGTGGYRKQVERNMERAVARGYMMPADFHRKRAELMENLATGVDDGRSRTSGLMGALYDYFRCEQRDTVQVWLSAETDHYSCSEGDRGWGCGYRNFQMLLSCLRQLEPYNNTLCDVPVPNIPRVQALIEEAWGQGVDPAGAAHFNNRLQGTRAWVGTTEIYALLTSLSVNARVVDFHKPTGQGGMHPRLFDWMKQYYTQANPPNGRLPPRVMRTTLPPIYLQHQGHSRSVVGLEQKRNGSLCLLLFDPGCPSSEVARLLEREPATVAAAVRRMRKFPTHLKHQQYQVLVAQSMLTPEQKQRQVANSRTFRAERIP